MSMFQKKDEFLKLKHWAVLGATNNQDKYGYKIVKELKDRGYIVYPVNPKYETICDLKCFDSIEDLPNDVEVVDIIVNRAIVVKSLKKIKEIGIEKVWFQPNTYNPEIVKLADSLNLDCVYRFCVYAELKNS